LRKEYVAFRNKVIPKLLNKKERPDIPEEDRKHLEFLRDVKKWFPYIIRHSSIDKLANTPGVNEYQLRKHAGWSKRSDMIERYTHGGSSVEPIMLALGVELKNSKKKLIEELKQEMVGPLCPFCLTSNIPGTQLCIKCGKPVARIAMDYIMKEAEETKKELKEMKEKINSMESAFEVMIKTGVMDPIIEQKSGNSSTDNMRHLVEKRRENLIQKERERMLDLMNIPFREDK
jgi:hypothetical protein